MNLKLREDLPENFTITKQVPGVGMMMFNTEKVQPQDYHKWHKMGFADLFIEYVAEPVIEAIVDNVIDGVKHKVSDAIVNRRKSKLKEGLKTFNEPIEPGKPETISEAEIPVVKPKRTPKK
jgi:hypothetical protein